MSSWSASLDGLTLLDRARTPGCTARLCDAIACIDAAADEVDAIALLRQATEALGGRGALFTSVTRDDATFGSYRSLLACDPLWAHEYARNGWCKDDPWLLYASRHSAPVRASEIVPSDSRQRVVVDAAATHGFASAMIVPAPSSHGPSRIGLLCIGSDKPGYFENPGYVLVKPLVRGLAMELHDWWHRWMTRDLIARAHITGEDLVLLQHEAQGHGSKLIATELRTEAKTIDCRFQRLNTRLGVANRRDAVRLGRLYGLI